MFDKRNKGQISMYEEVRKSKSLTEIFRPSRWLNYAVLVPFVLSILYYSFFAANRYVSETMVSVRSANESSSALSGLAVLAGVNSSSREDTLYLREYVHSLDIRAQNS